MLGGVDKKARMGMGVRIWMGVSLTVRKDPSLCKNQEPAGWGESPKVLSNPVAWQPLYRVREAGEMLTRPAWV